MAPAPFDTGSNPDKLKTLEDLFTGPPRVQQEVIELDEPFLEFAGRFAGIPGTVLLMSGGDLDCARYHILGAHPWLSLAARGRQITVTAGEGRLEIEADPLEGLRALLRACQCDPVLSAAKRSQLPLRAGLLGYLAYDLKDHLEDLPRTSVDDSTLPQLCYYAPALLMIHDRFELCTHRLVIRPAWRDPAMHTEENAMDLLPPKPDPASLAFGPQGHALQANFDRIDYMAAVAKIRDYIAAGHVYQVNMSQRFAAGFNGSAFGFFKALFHENPAPFFAYINANDHAIVSTSPERFIYRDGSFVETRPIKGTRPRGKTESEDVALQTELLQSTKDDAELSMIVDLLRNDLGKVCRGGTVQVDQHKRLEAYSNVYHLVSVVTGALEETKDSVDIIRATFPGGSITGCPKIRSMEIIDELEPHRRHIYTGSVGYLSFHDTMDLNIAIRTATILGDENDHDRQILFSVGGGIVFDSDPADEYAETLHKGKTLMEVLKKGHRSSAKKAVPDEPAMVWINGRLRPQEKARVPLTDLGLQYGYGFFETMRVQAGRVCLLTEHLDRFAATWQALFHSRPPDLSWETIIGQVIRANGLTGKIAAVKILATRGNRLKPPFNHTLAVTAREYHPRPAITKNGGLALGTYPERRQTPLANHKTLNYLYYFLAGQWAAANDFDEALILNPDSTISESNTCNLILLQQDKLLQPVSPAVLPGVAARAVTRALMRRGFGEEQRGLTVDDLYSADEVWATNALLGAVPVLSVDGRRLADRSGLWREINGEIQDGL